MRIPFEANAVHPEGRFLIQDPEYRKRILPLFDFAPGEPERRVEGQGTVFRIDPFGNCVTAFHVFESAFYLGAATGREMQVRQDRSIVALELDGIPYGAASIASSQWRPMNGAFSLVRIDDSPLHPPRLRNATELLALSILPSAPKANGTEFLHVDLNGWRPSIGETVLGIGYPNLDKDEDGPDDRPISQYLYGAYGSITDIEPLDLRRSRSWPMVRVNADWPGGMSGGPVFNAAGNVIGIISAGVDATTSTAMIFGGWGAVHNTLPSLDPSKPGSFFCVAILDAREKLIGVDLNRKAAESQAAKIDGAFVSKVSIDHETGSFVRLEL
ncbi:trypsin-like peptidase domain-containing protein [Bradyrhizobium sp. RT3a]|uniref:trypsin-like peptidase domain-containing protein n=1 Tax=unclassified Bradyrhizobium TaxID=2631580 RepID=UPI0033913D1A